MKQSRTMSLVEAIANVVVGYGVAVITQILVLPWFGAHMSLSQNLNLAATFTLISIVRSPQDGMHLVRLTEPVRSLNAAMECCGVICSRQLASC